MIKVLSAFGLHEFTILWPCSRLVGVLKLRNHLFNFKVFLGHGEPQVAETMNIESADIGACLYI
jgi:hypothetical protein